MFFRIMLFNGVCFEDLIEVYEAHLNQILIWHFYLVNKFM